VGAWLDPAAVRQDDDDYCSTACGAGAPNTLTCLNFNLGTTMWSYLYPGIATVEIGLEHYYTDTAPAVLNMECSWDAGVSWGVHNVLPKAVNDGVMDWIDVTADTVWSWAELDNANFQVCLRVEGGGPGTFSADHIAARVRTYLDEPITWYTYSGFPFTIISAPKIFVATRLSKDPTEWV